MDICRAIEIDPIAEGVETRQQADALIEMGCHVHQGYLYAEPMTADELLEYLSDRAAA